MAAGKHPGGRPTLYKPEYCDSLLLLMGEGKSLASVAKELGVSRKTLYNWQQEHPEFLHATEKGEGLKAAWWEEKALSALTEGLPSGSASILIFGLKNNAGWRDRMELSGDPDRPVALVDMSTLQPSGKGV